MVLIIGGAYQGKLDYAKTAFHIPEEEIYYCTGVSIDFSRCCINKIEEFTFACIQEGIDPVTYFAIHREKWQDSILICQDIFCGVVPMDAKMRQWRQSTGRLCQYLASNAEQVSRIFCGLELRLK